MCSDTHSGGGRGGGWRGPKKPRGTLTQVRKTREGTLKTPKPQNPKTPCVEIELVQIILFDLKVCIRGCTFTIVVSPTRQPLNRKYHCCLCLGAHLTISSTRRIISAASVAEIRACSLTRKASVTPNACISSTLPLNMFRPNVVLPFTISDRRLVTISAES